MSFQVEIGSLGGTIFQVGICTPLRTMTWSTLINSFFNDQGSVGVLKIVSSDFQGLIL